MRDYNDPIQALIEAVGAIDALAEVWESGNLAGAVNEALGVAEDLRERFNLPGGDAPAAEASDAAG